MFQVGRAHLSFLSEGESLCTWDCCSLWVFLCPIAKLAFRGQHIVIVNYTINTWLYFMWTIFRALEFLGKLNLKYLGNNSWGLYFRIYYSLNNFILLKILFFKTKWTSAFRKMILQCFIGLQICNFFITERKWK